MHTFVWRRCRWHFDGWEKEHRNNYCSIFLGRLHFKKVLCMTVHCGKYCFFLWHLAASQTWLTRTLLFTPRLVLRRTCLSWSPLVPYRSYFHYYFQFCSIIFISQEGIGTCPRSLVVSASDWVIWDFWAQSWEYNGLNGKAGTTGTAELHPLHRCVFESNSGNKKVPWPG